MPILALLLVGRRRLPHGGQFSLGRVGPAINWINVFYCAVTAVFFFFPSSPDPLPSEMNYAIAVFGVMLVVAIGFWFTNGKRTYLRIEDSAMRMEMARRLEVDEVE
ncbi:Choline transport [Lecanosticta acicola]|uniref:Choline transport n=1 Tax=Lecanosticta acicola TaxID=111012 RepID=A0AAI8Z611_9PEZI|nr:Choline transport [Lecanosticta acicola]